MLPTYQQFVQSEAQAVRDAYKKAHGVEPAPSDLYHNAWRRLVEGWTPEAILKDIWPGYVAPTPPTPPPVTRPALPGLVVRGRDFVEGTGGIWKYRGITAFTALQDFLSAQFDKLDAYAAYSKARGVNTWRVFGEWGVTNFTPWGMSDEDYGTHVRALADWLGTAHGLRLHFVVFTSQRDHGTTMDRIWARYAAVCNALKGTNNVLLEMSNEDWQNGRVAAGLPPASWLLSTRSAFPDGKGPGDVGSVLDFTTEHTPRSWDWPRKAKNLFETCRGASGPLGSGTQKPALAGEPMGIGNERAEDGKRSITPSDFAAYAAVAELMGAGSCVHGDLANLQSCTPPGPLGDACVRAVQTVWEAGIPRDLVTSGSYSRNGLSTAPLEVPDRYDNSGKDVNSKGALRMFSLVNGTSGCAVVVRAGRDFHYVGKNGWRVAKTAGPFNEIAFLSR